jgi:hypothetical protein
MADALSHRDMESAAVMAISRSSFQLFDNLQREIDDDPTFSALRTNTTAGNRGEDWCVVDGLILIRDHIYLPLLR